STTGLFATGPYDGRIHVVDERGAERFSVAATFATWSPDGKRIATVHGRRGEVRTSSGRLISSKRLATPFDTVPVWASPTRVAFDNAPSVGPNTIRTGSTFAVRLGTHVYTHVHGCDDDGGPVAAIQSLQAVPRSTSLVYQSYCAEPFHNLYAISPDGTGLRRITNVQADQVQPRLSPDRTRVAFAESQYTGLSCKGCPQALRTIDVDGTGAATLTTPPDCTFDDSPAWSPDGAQLAFSHSGCDSAPDVQVIAAGGGTPADRHEPREGRKRQRRDRRVVERRAPRVPRRYDRGRAGPQGPAPVRPADEPRVVARRNALPRRGEGAEHSGLRPLHRAHRRHRRAAPHDEPRRLRRRLALALRA